MKKTISAPCAEPRSLSYVVSTCGKTWFLQSLTGRPQTLILSRRASAVSKDGRRLAASEKASFDTPPSAVTQDEEGGGGGACPERSRGTATQGEGCRGTAEPARSKVEGPLLRVRRSGGLFGMSDVGAAPRGRPFRRCLPPWLSRIRTGTGACPYGEQLDDWDALPQRGCCLPNRKCSPSFRSRRVFSTTPEAAG